MLDPENVAAVKIAAKPFVEHVRDEFDKVRDAMNNPGLRAMVFAEAERRGLTPEPLNGNRCGYGDIDCD